MFAMRYRKIGAKIVYFRMLQGLTQEQLAEKLVFHRHIYRK